MAGNQHAYVSLCVVDVSVSVESKNPNPNPNPKHIEDHDSP